MRAKTVLMGKCRPRKRRATQLPPLGGASMQHPRHRTPPARSRCGTDLLVVVGQLTACIGRGQGRMQAAVPASPSPLGLGGQLCCRKTCMLARPRCARKHTSIWQRLDVAQDDAAHAVRHRPHLVLLPHQPPDLHRNPLRQLLHTRPKLHDRGTS